MVDITTEDTGAIIQYTVRGNDAAEVDKVIKRLRREWDGYMVRLCGIDRRDNGETVAVVTRWNTCD